MIRDHLKPYSGVLSLSAIADGINAAHRNSYSLVTDAEKLLEIGSFPTATALAILSLEESGKVSILRRMLTCDEATLKKCWKDYRSHTSKNFLAMVTDIIHQGGRQLLDFREVFSEAGKKNHELVDALKQVSIYTDCLGQVHWSEPRIVISEQVARSFVRDAKAMVSQEGLVSVRELELWQQHMNGPDLIKGLQGWAVAMEQEGLKTEGFAKKFGSFAKLSQDDSA